MKNEEKKNGPGGKEVDEEKACTAAAAAREVLERMLRSHDWLEPGDDPVDKAGEMAALFDKTADEMAAKKPHMRRQIERMRRAAESLRVLMLYAVGFKPEHFVMTARDLGGWMLVRSREERGNA